MLSPSSSENCITLLPAFELEPSVPSKRISSPASALPSVESIRIEPPTTLPSNLNRFPLCAKSGITNSSTGIGVPLGVLVLASTEP